MLFPAALIGLLFFVRVIALPQVDLGYEVHEALEYNEQFDNYLFYNIRYAQPPVGKLRFSAPAAPTGRNITVTNGNSSRICPQGWVSWAAASADFGTAFYYGNLSDYNYTRDMAAEAPIAEAEKQAYLNLSHFEDCLFLDVWAPKAIFDKRNSTTEGAPVFVWIHGGGYVAANKNDLGNSGNPLGLIKRSQRDGSDGFIFVAMNYRLGALGFLAGPSVEAAGGVQNAGLHDQRLALQWIQENIHLFGGDPSKVTVGGLSAGGGSIVHHIVADAGRSPRPFARAFTQSPGYNPISSNFQAENTTQDFLSRLNVSTADDARNVPTADIIQAKIDQIFAAPVAYVYGPVLDGSLVPALPGNLLLGGHFNGTGLDLLLSDVTYEGGRYNAPYVQTEEDFSNWLRAWQPQISGQAVATLSSLYPGTGPVRTIPLIGDYAFACNANWLARAFGNKTYNYQFNITTPFHGDDMTYTFYGSPSPEEGDPVIPSVADNVQGYITNFIKTGNPNSPGLPPFPQQGSNASLNVLNGDGISTQRDSRVGGPCEWLQKGLFI